MHSVSLPRLLLTALALAAGPGLLRPASQDGAAAEAAQEETPPRVEVHIDRNTSVPGYVELEELRSMVEQAR